MDKLRISDKIAIEDIPTWKNKVITISAQTGAGKSHFIKNTLYDYAKANGERILMLIHRLNCIEQFTMELEKEEKLDVIDIRTYQSNEYCSLPNGFDFNQYQYIVCDEFHYFLSDSVFNQRTEVSLERIINVENSTKILLSATSRNMKNYINNILKIPTIDYEFPYDYSFIDRLVFFYNKEYIEEYMKQIIKSGEKAIFFIQSATKGYELHKKYDKYTLYNCGKTDHHYDYVDKEKITKMLYNECFEEQILITTTCLEAGVNIKDLQLKHIILDVEDIDVMQQCIGRKRILSRTDNVNLYIHAINNNELGGKITKLNSDIKPAAYLLYNGICDYIKKYTRQKQSELIYDGIDEKSSIVKKVNKVMYYKKKYDRNLYLDIVKQKYGYCRYISALLGNKKYSVEENVCRKKKLEPLLEEYLTKKLFKKEKNQLISVIDVRVAGRQIKGCKQLNEALKWLDLPYIIIPKRTNTERYWIIEKIEDDNDDKIA